MEEVGVMEVGADPPMATEITGFNFEDNTCKTFFSEEINGKKTRNL